MPFWNAPQLRKSIWIQESWLRTGIVKREELAAFDGSAVESITEMQLIGDQLEKMELEDELEEIGDAENAQEEVGEENKNKEKTFSQPKLPHFSINKFQLRKNVP